MNYVKIIFIEHLMLIKVDLTIEGRKKKKEKEKENKEKRNKGM